MKLVLSIGTLALVFAGCATPVKVAWINQADAQAREVSTYKLRVTDPSDLEAARMVRDALAQRGFREASSGEAAQLFLQVDSGLGPPRVARASSGGTMLRSTAMMSTTIWAPNVANTHLVSRHVQYYEPNMNTFYLERTTAGAPFGRTTSHSAPATSAFFIRQHYLRIAAYESSFASTEQRAPEIWSVQASRDYGSDDLRKQLPRLVSAATDAIGEAKRGESNPSP